MDIVKSFNGYGKVSEIADRHFRRTTRRRLALLAASAVLLVVIVVSVGVVAAIGHGDGSPSPTSIADSIKAMCNVTRYPDSCFSSISTARGANLTDDPEELFRISLAVAVDAIGKVSTVAGSFEIPAKDKRLEAALRDCDQLFDSAIDRLNDSLSLMQPLPGEPLLNASKIEDLTTWLSAAVTDQETCLDGFEGTTGNVRDKMAVAMVNSTQYTSNSLAIVVGILGIMEKLDFPLHRKLLSVPSAVRYPAWISRAQRRALRQDMAARREQNVTVAMDGTGQVKTIKEAIDLAPKKNAHPFTIYIKEGVYKENVVVDKSKWNVIVLGDGMYKTIVDGKLNFIEGTPTFSTATFTAAGNGFMAMDMGFRNFAGPEKHQAVALRSSSDRSIFFRCSFDGHQNTLYAHSLRQFYRECDVAGTVDFIFGDAAVVFQDCKIRPRQALPHQQTTITAQGKTDPNENTGISIQACTIESYDNVTVSAYLGRPWKDYSTTIIMQSEIGTVVSPTGWLPMEIGTEPPSTIRYAEYQNTGPGSTVAGRVKWPGYNPGINTEEASKYTVETFIGGGDWIPATGVQFQSSLGQ
ncbi:pectinesterase 3 [Musa acuminata AAA Group]|uniref:pectinesterase 3 n=1 Tax=Musa acuminata AAA Group TaxID=214697 RepID=UPI0031D0AD97